VVGAAVLDGGAVEDERGGAGNGAALAARAGSAVQNDVLQGEGDAAVDVEQARGQAAGESNGVAAEQGGVGGDGFGAGAQEGGRPAAVEGDEAAAGQGGSERAVAAGAGAAAHDAAGG